MRSSRGVLQVKILDSIKVWVFRRRARSGIWFLTYMDRVMEVAGWGRREAKSAWADFVGSRATRQVILSQLARVNGIKQRRVHKSRLEIMNAQLRIEIGRLQRQLVEATMPTKVPVGIVSPAIKEAIENVTKEGKDEVPAVQP